MHLYISTPKTVLVVFHNAQDTGVQYHDGEVFVEGRRVDISIYGEKIRAESEFKYLGVTLHATNTAASHTEARMNAFDRAAGMLFAGLSRIPSFSHHFLVFLWGSLVAPVPQYGLELVIPEDRDIQKFVRIETQTWRRLLRAGGRAPIDAIHCMAPCTFDSERRVRKAGFFLKLANSPSGSWQHAAFVFHSIHQTAWFESTLSDLQIVQPSLCIRVVDGRWGLMVHSPGSWSDVGEWESAQAYSLPLNLSGHRSREHPPATKDDAMEQSPRRHVQTISSQLRLELGRLSRSALFWQVQHKTSMANYSKLSLLSGLLVRPGPALLSALGWVDIVSHRYAVVGFLCGDFFLGKYAANYFAKTLLPKTAARRIAVQNTGVDPARICLHCWMESEDMIALEDERHVMLDCPCYQSERAELLQEVTSKQLQFHLAQQNVEDKMYSLFLSQTPQDWNALGRFLSRVRQKRRNVRQKYAQRDKELTSISFDTQKAACRVRSSGMWVCRHGIFFANSRATTCNCIDNRSAAEPDWTGALKMPALSRPHRSIIVVRFNSARFRTINALRNDINGEILFQFCAGAMHC